MTDPTGWPDASKPGVPLNPERDGLHWVTAGADDDAFPAEWRAAGENKWGFWLPRWVFGKDDLNPTDCRYLGPCLTPQEVAAALAQAKRDGMEAAAVIAQRAIPSADPPRTDRYGDHVAGERHAARRIVAAIRAKAREPAP
jgi:hypothetical protein